MFGKLMCAVFVMAVSFTLVAADEFGAVVKKVEEEKGTFKITFAKVEKKKVGEDQTLPAAKDCKVIAGKFNKDDKKFVAGDAIEGGLKADIFAKIGDKGVAVRITTSEDGKSITQILTTGKKGK